MKNSMFASVVAGVVCMSLGTLIAYVVQKIRPKGKGLLEILSEIAKAKSAGRTFSEMMRSIVSRYANSGELNFKVEDKDSAIARVLGAAKALGVETGRSKMDGVRLEFADGWVSVRKSNTEPYLRLLVECRTREMLGDWVKRLSDAIVGE